MYIMVCVLSIIFSLSCKFSKPGKRGRRTRMMLVNQVALGKCKVHMLGCLCMYSITCVYMCLHVCTHTHIVSASQYHRSILKKR